MDAKKLSGQFMYYVGYNANREEFHGKIDTLATYENEIKATYEIGRAVYEYLLSAEGAEHRDELNLHYFTCGIFSRIEQIHDAFKASSLYAKHCRPFKTPEFCAMNERVLTETGKWTKLEGEFTVESLNKKASQEKVPSVGVAMAKTKIWSATPNPINITLNTTLRLIKV